MEVGRCLLVRINDGGAGDDNDVKMMMIVEELLVFGRNCSGMSLALTHSSLIATYKASSTIINIL